MHRSRLYLLAISAVVGTAADARAETQINPLDRARAVTFNGTAFDQPNWPNIVLGGDCNDTRPAASPLQTEVVGNLIDDDCDGLADEDANNNPSVDSADHDGDGTSLQAFDCDDTTASVRPGVAEVPANLIDDDCDGLADEDALGNLSPDVVDHDGDGVTIGSDRIFRSGFDI